MRRILVVEDSASTRSFIRSALETGGRLGPCDIVEASSGFDALRLLPRGPYDLVITDINMPDINGLELVRFVRQSERHREIPLLIISTQSSVRDRERGMALGADRFLAKPFTPEALRLAVTESLAGRTTTPGGENVGSGV